ncbi:MAG: Eco57I restriction-modification methylase domain-containing protein [Coprococcus sp.]
MEKEFKNAFDYKVIYVFEINDEKHRGKVKIGDATLHTTKTIEFLAPNSRELNQAALERIKAYTNTAGVTPKLLHTELAVRTVKEGGQVQLKAFRDHDVHAVLKNSGIKNSKIDETTGKEWFDIDLQTAEKAILAVKNNASNLSNTEVVAKAPIIFRPEQEEAIKRTIKQFKKSDRMLWNAKMRFGKTICALEVVRQMNFHKTIILTHRPVVNEGWYEDFTKIFRGSSSFIYGSKANGYTVDQLLNTDKNFVYFASVQDLRGSSQVGGKFDKNDSVFKTVWDCVIVDEAHEGTTTLLGEDTVKAVLKEGNNTKLLALSGTPFNILDGYEEDAIYTWDYIMEQECKSEWDKNHFGDSNPYEELPELRIYTYDLGQILHNRDYIAFEDKAFNFHEFFRTWTGDYEVDHANMPAYAKVGDFVHENDVLSFLYMLTSSDNKSMYPYSTEEYRNLFKHTLWIVPGVKEARALKKLMMERTLFGNGMFEIVNVAGNGDEEEKPEEALSKVKTAIKNAGEDNYTITLSCGKLTTGVTVREWTGVFMLAGSFSTSAANYLQTIFRVQSPCNINGKIKDVSYVFDFAPDRTLKMVSEAVSISAKAGKRNSEDKRVLGKFLNYCPVISIEGSEMKEYSATRLLQQLKRAYADKVVRNGFDDSNLYSDELFMLDDVDIQKFDELKGIIGTSKASPKANDITVNDQGLTKEEYEELEKAKKKPKKDLSPEEKARLEELKQLKKLRNDAISILRGISIRMPLLIYGAEIPYEEEITLDRFVDMVDDSSWEEFMPTGVTKDKFREFQKYYDEDVFIAAGRRIRNVAKEADTLNPTERVQKIAGLFKYFKNPDKETVLTPWRVVNMHMSLSLGGWDFYGENHKEDEMPDTPRFVDQGTVTHDVFFKPDTKILEINSKTGLYPLYVTYSVFRAKCEGVDKKALTIEKQREIWFETIRDNIYVVCKTPMAKAITKRTLLGFNYNSINSHYFDDLINIIANKPQLFYDKVTRESYWKKGNGQMRFEAVVGNPPFQEEVVQQVSETNGQAPRKSIFQYFQIVADKISSNYVSLIYPGARWMHRSGKGMEQFGLNQINAPSLARVDFFPDSKDIFSDVAIADGITMVFKNVKKTERGFKYVYHKDGMKTEINMKNPGEELIPLNPRDGMIVSKISDFVSQNNLKYLHDRVLPRNLFGIESNYVENNPDQVREYVSDLEIDFTKDIKLFTNDKAGKAGRGKWFVVSRNVIESNQDKIGEWQVVVSSANAGGQKRDNQIEVMDNHSAFGRSRVALASFLTKQEAVNFYKYAESYIIKFMFLMTDESLTSLGKKVPDILDYSDNCELVDFSTDINKELYSLFNLSEEEQQYIEGVVKNIRSKG